MMGGLAGVDVSGLIGLGVIDSEELGLVLTRILKEE
jgi:hypothetical protein